MSDDAPTLQRVAAVNHLVANVSNIQSACQAEGLGVRPMSGQNAPWISTSAYAPGTGVPAIPVKVGSGSYVSHNVATQQGPHEYISQQ